MSSLNLSSKISYWFRVAKLLDHNEYFFVVIIAVHIYEFIVTIVMRALIHFSTMSFWILKLNMKHVYETMTSCRDINVCAQKNKIISFR